MKWFQQQFFIFLLSFFFLPVIAFATTNELVFSGYAADAAGDPLTGAHDIALNLYTVATDGVAVWTETQNDVSFSAGFFTVALGSDLANPLPDFGDDLYLGIGIDGDTELSPRNEFFASVRSRVADVANALADAVLDSDLTWVGDQTFGTLTATTATITNLTVTTCTGCSGGSIDSANTTDSSSTSAAAATLYTQNVAAGTLAANGSVLRVKAWGTCAPVFTNTQTIDLVLGATVIASATLLDTTGPDAQWMLQADIIRVNASSVKTIGDSHLDDNTTEAHDLTFSTSAINVDLNSAFNILVQATPVGGTLNITAEGIYVEYIP